MERSVKDGPEGWPGASPVNALIAASRPHHTSSDDCGVLTLRVAVISRRGEARASAPGSGERDRGPGKGPAIEPQKVRSHIFVLV
jgi:hypothetical protein